MRKTPSCYVKVEKVLQMLLLDFQLLWQNWRQSSKGIFFPTQQRVVHAKYTYIIGLSPFYII
ncbi:hypothetical protein AXF42_Ash001142 [Apostasia shenzhenica]|uniref:Uncharacterized protein n=1 Tax=Apostasia shenzhenica TaxID=1088818 RepID=A0A2I0AU21_9ASPA|nr:hypothetical protein AXF42_Ash001142 [Apostasia shenzhenica]